jgi:hypothetical protein
MDSPAPSDTVELVETQQTPKPPVEVQKIPEAPRKVVAFYPGPRHYGTEIGQGCYWRRPTSGRGGG